MLKTFIHITHFLFRTGAFIFSLVSHKLILDVHDTFFVWRVTIMSKLKILSIRIYRNIHRYIGTIHHISRMFIQCDKFPDL